MILRRVAKNFFCFFPRRSSFWPGPQKEPKTPFSPAPNEKRTDVFRQRRIDGMRTPFSTCGRVRKAAFPADTSGSGFPVWAGLPGDYRSSRTAASKWPQGHFVCRENINGKGAFSPFCARTKGAGRLASGKRELPTDRQTNNHKFVVETKRGAAFPPLLILRPAPVHRHTARYAPVTAGPAAAHRRSAGCTSGRCAARQRERTGRLYSRCG